MESKYFIKYEGKIPSRNHAYGRSRWGVDYLKPEGKKMKLLIYRAYRGKTMELDTKVGYTLTVFGNWMNKPGAKTNIKKRDMDNLLKLIQDSCCDALSIDDSQIFEMSIKKDQSDTEGFEIEFYYL